MIQNLKIERFRGFSELEMQDCTQFNVILGENNSGKSSVLEALFLLSGPNNPFLYFGINRVRGFMLEKKEDTKVLFYKGDTSAPISLYMESADGTSRQIDIQIIRPREEVIEMNALENNAISNQSNASYGYLINSTLQSPQGEKNIQSELIYDLQSQDVKTKIQEDYEETLRSNFIPSRGLSAEISGFDSIIENKDKHLLIEALQTLEPELKDIAKIGNHIWVDLGYEAMLPSNVLGDGFRKILSIISAIYSSKNGILLIDEIDNGMHFKSLKSMWKALLKTASLCNVQVFASTHNIDSIEAYNKVLEENEIEDIQTKARIFALRKLPEHRFKTYKYEFEQFNYLINEEVELR